MAGTLNRFRWYLYCDLSPLEIDYVPPVADYPDFPRQQVVDFFKDDYKSALGSNYWRYNRGTSASYEFNWVDCSDDAQATMGLIVASAWMLSPHIVIFDSQGIDGISLASCLASVAPLGTYFAEVDSWEPQETVYGLWNFKARFRKEN